MQGEGYFSRIYTILVISSVDMESPTLLTHKYHAMVSMKSLYSLAFSVSSVFYKALISDYTISSGQYSTVSLPDARY